MEQIDIRQELRAMTDGMGEWVERRERRRTNALRTAIAGVAIVVTMVAFLIPQRADTFVDGALQCCTAEACEKIDQMIAKV